MAPCATLTDGNPTRIRCTTIPGGPHSNTRQNSVHCESSDKNDSSIEGMVTSQFEQHLRAILGVPLGDTAPRSAAIMVNLLGAEGASGPVRYEGLEEALAMPGVYLHLYGKAQTRPHRKMGHITVTDAAFDQARTKAFAIKQLVRVTT